jgi:DNA polymerase-3 subunit beta
MKISCTKENISRALSLVGSVTGKNVNLPILSNILFKADEQKVELIATNLELAIVVSVRAKIEVTGSFTVPARTLADFINLLPNERIDFEVKENELHVACGKSTTKIKGTSAEDFPIIPTVPEGAGYLINAEALKESIAKVLPAVAKNDIRPELAGVFCFFDIEHKQLVLATTDSYRLAEKKVKIEQGEVEQKIILPSRTATEINHLLSIEAEENEKNARILVGDGQIMVNFGNAQVFSRLVEGVYPDYTQIIPREFNTTVLVDTDHLMKEMKAAGLFTTTGVNAVTMTVQANEGLIGITSTSSQTGEYKSEIGAEISGADATVLLNNRYMLDGLNNFNSPETYLKIINSDSACVLNPKGDESYLYIVMPIRQ